MTKFQISPILVSFVIIFSTACNKGGGGGGTSSALKALSCSTNIVGGFFENPMDVSLNCSEDASIKYCLQLNECCDPKSSGLNYEGPILIGGESNGAYCLSFYGLNEKSETIIYQKMYTIDAALPNLQVYFSKTQYQSTQLYENHFLTSTDFSKSNFEGGVINLKSHNPNLEDLNFECHEVIQNYSSLIEPSPEALLLPFDLSTKSLGNELIIPLDRNKLFYGDNFIFSYIVNNNFENPLYSCTKNKIVLNDFLFFSSEVTHTNFNSDGVREFSGSFSPYSFFVEKDQTFRPPTGASNAENNLQELRTGSFSVFY